jgi:hypothetical protein
MTPRHSSALPVLVSARDAPSASSPTAPKGARGTPDPIGPACSDASRHRNVVHVERDSAETSAFRARCLKVCSTATLVGLQFLPTTLCGPERQHPPPVSACLAPGKTAAWTAAPERAYASICGHRTHIVIPFGITTLRGWRCCRRQIPPDGPAFVTLDRKRP